MAIVVGAAIVRAGHVLAARRSEPPELAGRWELPGGKVDLGESDTAALIRECREELGVTIGLGRRVGGEWPIGESGVLRVWLATIVEGEPYPREHAELRWLEPAAFYSVEWLPADLPVIRKMESLLNGA